MKKASIFLGAVILAAGLVGCGGEKAAETKAPEKLRVGLTAYKYDDNFIALFRQVVSDEAAKLLIKLITNERLQKTAKLHKMTK